MAQDRRLSVLKVVHLGVSLDHVVVYMETEVDAHWLPFGGAEEDTLIAN